MISGACNQLILRAIFETAFKFIFCRINIKWYVNIFQQSTFFFLNNRAYLILRLSGRSNLVRNCPRTQTQQGAEYDNRGIKLTAGIQKNMDVGLGPTPRWSYLGASPRNKKVHTRTTLGCGLLAKISFNESHWDTDVFLRTGCIVWSSSSGTVYRGSCSELHRQVNPSLFIIAPDTP